MLPSDPGLCHVTAKVSRAILSIHAGSRQAEEVMVPAIREAVTIAASQCSPDLLCAACILLCCASVGGFLKDHSLTLFGACHVCSMA